VSARPAPLFELSFPIFEEIQSFQQRVEDTHRHSTFLMNLFLWRGLTFRRKPHATSSGLEDELCPLTRLQFKRSGECLLNQHAAGEPGVAATHHRTGGDRVSNI
jgi:hypothetical protein